MYTVLVSGLYALATRAPSRTPIVIESSTVDGLIPFVPAAAVIYATYFLLLPALISACGPSAARPASAKATAVRRSFSEGGSRRAGASDSLELRGARSASGCAWEWGPKRSERGGAPRALREAGRPPGFREVFTVAMGCGLANAVVYNVVPTRIAARTVAPDGSLLAILQQLDTTLCAIPSGHVSLPAAIATAALLVARRSGTGAASLFWRRAAAIFALWTVALAASTLLTKQHVVVDVVAGVTFGLGIAIAGLLVLSAADRRRASHPRPLRSAIHLPSAMAFLLEWTLIVAAVATAMQWWNGPVIVLLALFIATRQHAILVLYHDGVHCLVARNRRVNDFIVNAFVGVPLLLPIHLYRALHLSHHRHLGADCDPERVLLYRGQPWTFRPLAAGALARQLAGDVLAWNGIVMTLRYLRERSGGRALRLPRTRPYPELTLQFMVFAGAVAGSFALWPVTTLQVALLWFVPYVTVTQLLQKVRSFAEHATADADPSLSCSWSPGLLGRLTIWPYNINYHREHHARPKVPWDRLPEAFPAARQRPGRDLLAHLWSGASR